MKRTRVLGVDVDVIRLAEAVDRILEWIRNDERTVCRDVVTPNLDHAVLHRESAEFRAAYCEAALVLADGAPLVWASRLTQPRASSRSICVATSSRLSARVALCGGATIDFIAGEKARAPFRMQQSGHAGSLGFAALARAREGDEADQLIS
jgi:UDP-N-acetyl-D-mannosaminuronic acid transferase (WecB/TagA/CpsF family)